jgi:hypothetical protein
MILDKEQLSGHESEIDKLKKVLATATNEKYNGKPIEISDLIENKEVNWNAIKCLFANDFRYFENVFFKLHLKRNVTFSDLQRERIIIFLLIGYLNSRDIRYFNEFLYFYKEAADSRKFWLLMIKLFFDNLTEDNHHLYPLCDKTEIQEFLRKAENEIAFVTNKQIDVTQRVGLLGSPTFFKKIRSDLLSKGFDVRCYFIPFHPDRKIDFVLKNSIAFRLFCLFKGINFSFFKLDSNHTAPKIGEKLKADKLAIGFHKLGFIIKRNIIEVFSIGLINDHWAILPYVRGRSTIEYSILLNIPLVATAHFVEEEVDSGDIIKFYNYNDVLNVYSTINEIRNHFRRQRESRAVDSIEILSKTKKANVVNQREKGLTFYSMHPLLKKFIENNILKQRKKITKCASRGTSSP